MPDDSRVLARRWFEEVWNERRSETIDELMASDAVGHLEGLEAVGPDAFKTARAALLGAFPDMRVTVEDVIADGEHAVVRWRVDGTHHGDDLGFARTGRPVAFRGLTWLRFVDGRLVEGWDAWNQGALVASLSS
jgi:steroid delta-isomerase-like uncharacterized protein